MKRLTQVFIRIKIEYAIIYPIDNIFLLGFLHLHQDIIQTLLTYSAYSDGKFCFCPPFTSAFSFTLS